MDHALLALLAAPQRLALAYAPRRARPAWLALLALDARLGQQVRVQREPILTQLRLAWWRERLGEPAGRWPKGEPQLEALSVWQGEYGSLTALVDGWEELLGDAPLSFAKLENFVAGRAVAFQTLARVLGRADADNAAHRAGEGWAIADLAAHVTHPEERAGAMALAKKHDWRRPRLPRELRPLSILHGLSARAILRKDPGTIGGRGDFFVALRLGILGL